MNRTKRPAAKRPAAAQAPVVLDPTQLSQVQGGAYEYYVPTKGEKQGSGTGG